MKKDDSVYLHHILEAINRIEVYSTGTSYQDFLQNGLLQDGVIRQLEIIGEDFYLDLLFYHLRLRSFVVVELKTSEFKPEHAGKLNFYLSATDDLLRHSEDNPTICILLCRGKNRVVVEYALRNVLQPSTSRYLARQLVERQVRRATSTCWWTLCQVGLYFFQADCSPTWRSCWAAGWTS